MKDSDSDDPTKTNRDICSGEPLSFKGRSNQTAYNHDDNFRRVTLICPSVGFCSFAHLVSGRKDWLVGRAAHRKWRLHSFPSACRWSLILVQLSGTFTKRWNPAAELCRILYLWRDDRYRWSTNKRWITRDLHSGQIFQLAIKSYLLLTGNDGRKWYVVIIVERAALSLQSCLYDAKKVEKIRIPALRNIKPLMGSDSSDF